ncbi:MAG TPA: hypothetical protein VEV65_07175 [Kineosporiaceae bacterium]|nr:hypothetical protein [Kineosporiaceae bacterium]
MATDTDAVLTAVLARFAAVASLALKDPGGWMGSGDDRPDPLPVQALQRARLLLTGKLHPGAPGWDELPVERRDSWWVRRIQAVAAPIAATPRVFGVLADRVPVQGAFGTAVAGLVVCAVAREHGVRDPAEWVPLLGRVLFERELGRPQPIQMVPPPDQAPPPHAGPLRKLGGALWRLTQVIWEAQSLFDERPRGAWFWRTLGKVPIVGLPAGVLDERGAVARAAELTADLVTDRGYAPAS